MGHLRASEHQLELMDEGNDGINFLLRTFPHILPPHADKIMGKLTEEM